MCSFTSEKLTSWRIYDFIWSERVGISELSFCFQWKEVDILVLHFTRYPACLVYVRNGLRTNRVTFETKKIEEKRPVLSIGRTRTSKGQLPRRVRILVRKGQLTGLVIGRTLIRKGQLQADLYTSTICQTASP